MAPQLSEKQYAVWRRLAFDDDYRYCLIGGAVGAGKSMLSCLAWFVWINSGKPKPGGVTLLVGKTQQTVQDNILQVFRNEEIFGDLADTVPASRGLTSFDLFGHPVVICSANDVTAYQKLKGKNIVSIIADEVATFNEHFFVELQSRLRWGDNLKMFCSFNPEHPDHWLKKDYIDRLDDNGDKLPLRDMGWRYIKMYMDDNPALSEDFKKNKRNASRGVYYLRDVMGEFAAADNLCFYSFDRARHVVPWQNLPEMSQYLAVGMDYGDNAASAAVLLGLNKDQNCLYIIDEFSYKGAEHGQISPTELSSRLKNWFDSDHGPHLPEPTPNWMFIDPGGGGTPFRNQLLVEPAWADYRRRIYGASKGKIRDGVEQVNSLLAANKLMVADRCTGLLNEMYSYHWEGDKAVGADHYCDALRYAIRGTYGDWWKFIKFGDIDQSKEATQ